jgi:hypothetical protein
VTLFPLLAVISYGVGAPFTLGWLAGGGLRASDGPVSVKKPRAV